MANNISSLAELRTLHRMGEKRLYPHHLRGCFKIDIGNENRKENFVFSADTGLCTDDFFLEPDYQVVGGFNG